MSSKYLLAVDGGGSNTVFCLHNCKNGEERFYSSGSTNYKISFLKNEREIILGGIRKVMDEAGASPNEILGLVMGMSGCDSPNDHNHYLDIAAGSSIDRKRIYICNDSELAFYAKGTPPGLCMIAGTGSVATGVAADRTTARAGGWGSPISDEGSGGWIGIQVLKALLRHCDGYEAAQPIFDKLRVFFNAKSFDELPKMLSRFSMGEIASAARPTMDLADEGDEYCLRLVCEAAVLVAEVAYCVYDKLDFKAESRVDIVMAGSLYKSPTFKTAFQTELIKCARSSNMVFHNDEELPVMGGIAIAKERFCN